MRTNIKISLLKLVKAVVKRTDFLYFLHTHWPYGPCKKDYFNRCTKIFSLVVIVHAMKVYIIFILSFNHKLIYLLKLKFKNKTNKLMD